MYTYIHILTFTFALHIDINTHIFIHMHTYLWTHTYVHTYIHTFSQDDNEIEEKQSRKPTEAEELASAEAEKEKKAAMDELSNIEIKEGDYQIQGFS